MCYGQDNEINYYDRRDDVSYFVPGSLGLQNIYIKAGFIQSPTERLNLSNPSV